MAARPQSGRVTFVAKGNLVVATSNFRLVRRLSAAFLRADKAGAGGWAGCVHCE